MSKFYRNGKGFFGQWTKGSGLYLLLGGSALVLLCLVALLLSPKDPAQQVEGNTDTSSAHTDSSVLTDSHPSDGSQTDSLTDSPVNGPVEDSQGPVSDVEMIRPVSGTAGTGFSLTVPVFSETMNDWRVHQGIDYLTEGEVPVYAAADGIVENVYTSELMGLTVEIRHEDDTISIYQSLSGEPKVLAGQEVKQGDEIGLTGTSADCECLVGNHLHFALIRAGVYLDPNDRFPS